MSDSNPSGRSGWGISLGTIILVVIIAVIARFLFKLAIDVIYWIVIIGVVIAVVSFLISKFKGRRD